MSKYFNKIENGDALKILKKIPDKTFNLVFADPPYNLQIGKKLRRPDNSKVNGVNDRWDCFKSFEDYDSFCKKWLKECKRVLKDNGALWVIGYLMMLYGKKIIQCQTFEEQDSLMLMKL